MNKPNHQDIMKKRFRYFNKDSLACKQDTCLMAKFLTSKDKTNGAPYLQVVQ